ncbi:MAG TPA: prephenate dehydrogenase/arogenate dehydrogenase family protein [Ilumatobacteraceae bacterium]|nr:prephenate dehydrogenase/arogenate dehydrogenase family protein [Ilumatobacteraceae bacterium]
MTDPLNAPLVSERRANVIGLGLIGGSVALALRRQGWTVSGDDAEAATAASALERGVVDTLGLDVHAEITFVAVPVLATVDEVKRALAETSGAVTDVGSVKAAICASAADNRFVGGHPMAGSELDGLDGAQGDLFEGAVWVLTPGPDSDDGVFARVASVVASLGAEVVALTPERHDQLVAVVSHVPHLTAATLMGLASDRAEEHAALLRLAAGGFRDMTRVASGRPGIWLDICAENRTAIVEVLDQLIGGLAEVRDIIGADDREALFARLTAARHARSNLPTRVVHPDELAEVRIPIPDRAGAAAEVFTLAAELSVNIASFEVVHVAESTRGVAVVLIDRAMVELFRGGLLARGFRPAVQPLS